MGLGIGAREARMDRDQMTDPIHLLGRCRVAAKDLRVSPDAVMLVRLILENLTRALGPDGRSSHISAAQLCENLLRCDATAERSADQLRRIGIESSETVGRIVE